MAALSEQLDRARGGAGTVVLVEGDAGMGKSRLLDEAVAVARRRGFRIGISAADPGDSMVELATLMAALFDGPDRSWTGLSSRTRVPCPSRGTGYCRIFRVCSSARRDRRHF